ncbi:NUDIX hydrolase [Rhizobium acaciae]|uniref:NUDIX hydrolase n=1 Tax=Rhizobium acaciae TaxID=2989736 RepID=UPI003F9B55E6
MPVEDRNRFALAGLTVVTAQMLRGEAVMQYGAICVRQPPDNIEVLLITSRESGRWVIPKGWGIGKKKPHIVAAQEAWEEAGVLGKVKKKPIGFYTYVKKLRKEQLVPSLVQVHLLNVLQLSEDFPESGQRQLRWFSPDEAAASVDEVELASLLRRTGQFFDKA